MIDISREIAAPSSQELDINDTTKNSLAASKLYQHNGACRVVTSNLKPLNHSKIVDLEPWPMIPLCLCENLMNDHGRLELDHG